MCLDSGARKVPILVTLMVDLTTVKSELRCALLLISYVSEERGMFKVMGVQ